MLNDKIKKKLNEPAKSQHNATAHSDLMREKQFHALKNTCKKHAVAPTTTSEIQ
jgi:hypothetical protein